MKKGTAIFLIVSSIALACIAGVCLMELKRMATDHHAFNEIKCEEHTFYIPYRDTVIIDRSKERKNTDHEYQIEISDDYIHIYESQRLVSSFIALPNRKHFEVGYIDTGRTYKNYSSFMALCMNIKEIDSVLIKDNQ